ncbi:class I SAM-dependent methyltransferase [Subtercola endophyticus]|uniref:class I SAM-dependent methyltransferase n=1 Tax=Subtercola endophyticus TaxID=2895559 RepID=UPI001E5653A8|nr:class I SAM-dependent methyltransferase [Subtercola endophyticus]UFS58535.1 class I SAM-dependent methyltransferase [Subtercola endophyticus]
MARDTTHALSFGQNVSDYERGRPGYPDAAVEWMLAQATPGSSPADTEPVVAPPDDAAPGGSPAGSRFPLAEPGHAETGHATQGYTAAPGLAEHPLAVVDVGAGTGKFTASLVSRGLAVTAVEPDAVMRQTLAGNLPSVVAVSGTAEHMPLPDASADLVTFAQAWHWVDVPTASAEVARVLKADGVLALVWNMRDNTVDWVARLSDIMGASGAEEYDTISPSIDPPMVAFEHARFGWDNELSRDQLFAMITSRSYVIAMQPAERDAMLERVAQLLDTHPQLAGRTSYLMPYETRVTLARRA